MFDFYNDIVTLDGNMVVRADTPMDSARYHKLIYVLQDNDYCLPKKVLILPYLHEKRIYLNRLKVSTEYFYTSIVTMKAEEFLYKKIKQDELNAEIQLKKSISL